MSISMKLKKKILYRRPSFFTISCTLNFSRTKYPPPQKKCFDVYAKKLLRHHDLNLYIFIYMHIQVCLYIELHTYYRPPPKIIIIKKNQKTKNPKNLNWKNTWTDLCNHSEEFWRKKTQLLNWFDLRNDFPIRKHSVKRFLQQISILNTNCKSRCSDS